MGGLSRSPSNLANITSELIIGPRLQQPFTWDILDLVCFLGGALDWPLGLSNSRHHIGFVHPDLLTVDMLTLGSGVVGTRHHCSGALRVLV